MEEVEGASDTRNMAGLNGDRPVSGSKQDASKASSPRSKHSETPQRKGSVGSRSENQRIKAKAEKDSVENSSDANNELSDDSTSTDSSDSDVEETLKPKKAAKKSSKKAKTGRKTSKDRKHSRKHKLKDGEEHDADSDSSSGSGSDEEQKSSADRELQDRIAQIETRVHIANIKNKARLAEIERQAHIAQFENIFRNLSSQSYPTYVPPPQSPSLARREAQSLVTGPSERRPKISNPSSMPFPPEEDFENWPRDPVSPRSYSSKANTSTRSEFKRVDWVWDSTRYTYKLQDTTETNADDKYDGYVFHIRRTFDHEGKYLRTFVDIKSKLLRECLQDVIKAVPGISLVDETPKLDPNMLFL